MDKVTVGSIADSKPSMVVSVEAAATITVGAGELVIAVGTNVKDVNNQRAVSALDNLRDLLRENQYPVGPLAFTVAASVGLIPNKTTDLLGNEAAIPVFDEDQVVIVYDSAFYDAGNSENIGSIIARAIEVYQEQVLKFN